MKITISRVFRFFVLIVLLCSSCFIVLSCSEKQKKDAVTKYGMRNAYIKINNNKDLLVLNNNTAEYYISSDIKGDYYTISDHAIKRANAISGNVTIKQTSNSNSDFKFTISDVKSSYAAMNYYEYAPKIISSTIEYNKKNMDKMSLQAKKHAALHEMGHTFGLNDINDSVMKGYTVMYSDIPTEKYLLEDYSEFDKYNITWHYGE